MPWVVDENGAEVPLEERGESVGGPPDIDVVMMTMDRTPSPNYLRGTLDSLEGAGVFAHPRLSSFTLIDTYMGGPGWPGALPPRVAWAPSTEGRRTPNENFAAALEWGAWLEGARLEGWVLLLEDDIEVGPDFLGSVGRWLDDHGHLSCHVFALGSAHTCDRRYQSFWPCPIDDFYGTQAIALRPNDAVSLAQWVRDHPLWNGKGDSYDLIMHDWHRHYWPEVDYFAAAVPSLVEHTGRVSVINPRKSTHTFPTFDPAYTYRPPQGEVTSACRRVRRVDFDTLWLRRRAEELGYSGTHKFAASRVHRKTWEHAVLCQAALEHSPDRYHPRPQALGFGVGLEPIPAWLAARGWGVIATDGPESGDWEDEQHAGAVEDIPLLDLTDEEFDERVVFDTVDMNDLSSLEAFAGDFDFVWSSSCMEHLGGIEAGIDFFVATIRLLAPGGVTAHTTEYNVDSNDATLEAHNLCVFRRRDLERLSDRVRCAGAELFVFDFAPGQRLEDSDVLNHPYRAHDHLVIRVPGAVTTSVLLIAQRR